jgi:hypothetical protein
MCSSSPVTQSAAEDPAFDQMGYVTLMHEDQAITRTITLIST